MGAINVILPESLQRFVDERVGGGGYGSDSDYLRDLIRRDQDRLRLQRLLLDGATSGPTAPVDDAYFNGLRARVGSRARG